MLKSAKFNLFRAVYKIYDLCIFKELLSLLSFYLFYFFPLVCEWHKAKRCTSGEKVAHDK